MLPPLAFALPIIVTIPAALAVVSAGGPFYATSSRSRGRWTCGWAGSQARAFGRGASRRWSRDRRRIRSFGLARQLPVISSEFLFSSLEQIATLERVEARALSQV